MNNLSSSPVRTPRWVFPLAALIALTVTPRTSARDSSVTTVPPALVESLQLRPFYTKHVSARGFPVLASERVSNFALLEAAYLTDQMLAGRDDIRAALIKNKVRFAVMAHDEFKTMVPEHSDLQPAKYWDKRARGLGATPRRPAVSCGEENLLGYPGDPYATENILIHEFAHAIHEMGLNTVDPTFDPRLKAAYEQALAAGLWKGAYAATSRNEYWAEGVQSWFDTNRENDPQHNHVNTRAELNAYDPALAKLIAEVFGDRPWRYRRPADRPATEKTHLQGFEVASAPKFSWPAELLEWNKQYLAKTQPNEADRVALTLLKPDAQAVRASPESTRDTSILFLNRRATEVSLHWLDFKGERRFYAKVGAGQTHAQQTFSGHRWLITDEAGQPLGVIVADDEPSKAVIE
ncbi:MAG: hypothetical protein HYY24_03600 [Verrucomicrobia bacterium]|nr:hypothetical protein [Verrucomicrobiota bacterium]